MKPNATLPPWIARNERERQEMVAWVNARLDEQDAEERRRQADPFPPVIPPEHAEKYNRWRDEGGLERLAAQHGVIGPARDLIRSRWPLLADLVQLPPLGRGEKYLRSGGVSITDKRRDAHGRSLAMLEAHRKGHVVKAAWDVQRIKRIWQDHYGRKNRHATDGPSANEIAAERHGVTAEEVELHLKMFLRTKSRIC
jgi:hypothetical protein